MVFDGPKLSKSIEKQTLWFSGINKKDEKTMPKGSSEVIFLVQDGDMGHPGSTYPLILDVLVRCQNIIIFGRPPDGPENRKNGAVQRQRADKNTPGGNPGDGPIARGVQALASKDEKTTDL